MIKTAGRSARLDFIGSIVSLLCAIHCLAFPLLISWGSLMTISTYEHDIIEPILLAVGLILCVWSVSSSYKAHRKTLPFKLLFAGTAIIILGRLFPNEVLEVVTNTSGAILLASSHIYNHRFTKMQLTSRA